GISREGRAPARPRSCRGSLIESFWNAAPGKDEHQLVRGAAGEPVHRASKRATLFAPGAGAPTTEFARRSTALGAIGCAGDSGAAGGGSHPGVGAPTRRRQRKVGSSSPIAARGLDVPRQRVPPGRSAPALRQPEPVQPREGRAPARPWCSRRARPSSQQARYAVRTRGGCSYKATPEESWLIESDRGPWARRSQAACTPGAQRTRATPTRAGATLGRTSTSSSTLSFLEYPQLSSRITQALESPHLAPDSSP